MTDRELILLMAAILAAGYESNGNLRPDDRRIIDRALSLMAEYDQRD